MVETGDEAETGNEAETGDEVETGSGAGAGAVIETGCGGGVGAACSGAGAGTRGGEGIRDGFGAIGGTERAGANDSSLDVTVISDLGGDNFSNSRVFISSFASDFPSTLEKLTISWIISIGSSSVSLLIFLFLTGSQYTV